MRGQKRKQFFALILLIFVLTLIVVTKYLEKPRLFQHDTFLKLILSRETDTNISRDDVNTTDTFSVSQTANISVKVICSENDEKIFKVEYPNAKENFKNRYKKVLFVEMKEIKPSTLNVFFVETSCSTEKAGKGHNNSKAFMLNARQCCAVESTALMNLDRDIYVLHSCPLDQDFIVYSPKFVEKLFAYPNVHVVRINNTELFLGSPIQDLYEKKKLETSSFPIEHTSDAFRFLLLWKFGGTYCDLDVVTIRSLHSLKTNWAGAQDSYTVASGVLNFEPDGVGHEILQRTLEHMNLNFDGTSWSTNGPLLITKFVLEACKVSNVTSALKNCHTKFTPYKTDVFYPLYYTEYFKLFDENIGTEIVNYVKSQSFSVHIWNKMSHHKKGMVGSSQAYALLAEEFCPNVYQNCGSIF